MELTPDVDYLDFNAPWYKRALALNREFKTKAATAGVSVEFLAEEETAEEGGTDGDDSGAA